MHSEDSRDDLFSQFMRNGFELHQKGQYDDALRLYDAATLLMGMSKGSVHIRNAQLFVRIGDVYAAKLQYCKAEHYYRHGLAEYEQLKEEDSIDIAIVLRQISVMCKFQGKNRQASNLMLRSKRCLEIQQKQLEKVFLSPSAREQSQ